MNKTLEVLLEKAFSQEDAVEADEARIALRFLLEWIGQGRPVERRGEFSGLLSSEILPSELSWKILIDLDLGQRELEWVVGALKKRFLTQDSEWIHIPYVLRGIAGQSSVQSLMSKYLSEFRELDPQLTHVIECDFFYKYDDSRD